MSNEVSVGNVVERLINQYSSYNPSKYLSFLPSQQQSRDSIIISKIRDVDSTLSKFLNELYRNLLLFRRGNVQLDSEHILDLLKYEYSPLIQSLTDDLSDYAKILYNNWKIEWMVSKLKSAELYDDEIFAKHHYLPITKEVKNKLWEMREYIFTEDELLNLFGDEYEAYIDEIDND